MQPLNRNKLVSSFAKECSCDVHITVLTFLDPSEVCRTISRLSRYWKGVVASDDLWTLFHSVYQIKIPKESKNLKESFFEQYIFHLVREGQMKIKVMKSQPCILTSIPRFMRSLHSQLTPFTHAPMLPLPESNKYRGVVSDKYVMCSTSKIAVKVISTDGARQQRVLYYPSICFMSLDGDKAVIGNEYHCFSIWDLKTGAMVKSVQLSLDEHRRSYKLDFKDGRVAVLSREEKILSVVYDEEMSTHFSICSDFRCMLWPLGENQHASSFSISAQYPRDVKIGRKLLLISQNDLTFTAFNFQGKCLQRFIGHSDCYISWGHLYLGIQGGIAISAVKGDDRIKCWNIESGTCLRAIQIEMSQFKGITLQGNTIFASINKYVYALQLLKSQSKEQDATENQHNHIRGRAIGSSQELL